MTLTIYKRDDPWLDNGILVLSEMINNIKNFAGDCIDFDILPDRLMIEFRNKEKAMYYFTAEVQNQLNTNILIKTSDSNGGEKFVIRDHILLQYGKKVNGINTVGERLFSLDESKNIVEAFFNQGYINEKVQLCILCGEEYDPEVSSKLHMNNLKQAVHPLTTKNSAISHVRTYSTNSGYEKGANLSYYNNICINCYMLGVMQSANSGTIYNIDISKEKAYTLMPYINNLREAWNFRNKYIKEVLTSARRYSNIKLIDCEKLDIRGKHCQFLLFIEYLAAAEDNNTSDIHVDEQFAFKNDIKKFKYWYQLETGTGSLKNPTINILNISDNIYELVFTQRIKLYLNILRNIWFQDDFDTTCERKEDMADAFLNDNFYKFVLSFRPSEGQGIKLKGRTYKMLYDLIYKWRWRQVGLSAEVQKTIKAVGYIIATTSQYKKSLIYRLEKVRTKNDLLNVQSEVSKGFHAVYNKIDESERKYLNPSALNELTTVLNDESLDKMQFEIIKDTLMIHSFVNLTRKSKNGDA